METGKKVAKIVGWVVSVLAFCLGLLLVDSYAMSGILIVLAGLAINPLLMEKIHLKGWIAILLAAVLFVAAIIATPEGVERGPEEQSNVSYEVPGENNSSESPSSSAEGAQSVVEPEAPASSSAEPEIETPATYKAGMYKVGVDIPAGEYKLTADTNRGYYEVCKDAYGTIASIVSNDSFESTAYVQVEAGQYLKIERATAQQVQD